MPGFDVEQWYRLMQSAMTTVRTGQDTGRARPAITLIVEPSFDNSFCLQLVIAGDTLSWYRTTWLRLEDAAKLRDPIASLMYIGQELPPGIRHENGTADAAGLREIRDAVRTLSVSPPLEAPGIVLDGTYYRLTIGNGDAEITYKWHYLPGEWASLRKLTDLLEIFNTSL